MTTPNTGLMTSTTAATPPAAGAPTTGAAGDKGGTGAQGAPAGKTPPAAAQGGTPAAGSGKPTEGNAQQGGDKQKETASGGAEPQKAAPADFELKLPEGVTADAGLMSGFKEVAKAAGWKGEDAQKVVDLFAKFSAEQGQKAQQTWSETQDKWMQASKTDKEFGGEKFPVNLEGAKKALTAIGTPELRQLLDDAGISSHPEVIRLFHRIGTRIKEDSIAGTNGTGAAAGSGGDAAFLRQLYPSMHKEQ